MNHKILFIHIPKTGGVTVNHYIGKQFDEEKRALFIDNADYEKLGFFDPYRYISGHVRLSQVAPYLLEEPCYKFTIVRNPLEQLFSHLYLTQSKIQDGKPSMHRSNLSWYYPIAADIQHVDLTSADSLACFLQSKPDYLHMFDNQQTRFLLNAWHNHPLTFFDVKVALANLKAFDFVGLTSHLKQSINYVATHNKLETYHDIEVRNGQNIDYAYAEHSAEIKSAIKDSIKYDEIIYAEAQEMFANR